MRIGNGKRGSGGVAVFIKDSLCKYFKRVYEHLTECIVVNVSCDLTGYSNELFMIFSYISPERSVIYDEDNDDGLDILRQKLLLIRSDFSSALILLAGDLNARTGDLIFRMTILITLKGKLHTLATRLMRKESQKTVF
ncbi:hypothetical protein DPMN_026679 [Dreissena polymorpha]|uniref:Endonuclease/exonuclease/phosphatase domain-containing protein n=1 Tax=Dreissena polymorpha TaxID=45954 RepID=A0A9D4LTW3_DREPO|nr:hypothetical protein DPMN_026679 [Dreissena polymorpha]